MARSHSSRDGQKEAYWLKTLEDWSKSGDSCNAYCVRKGLKGSTFRWWKKELGRRGKWPAQGGLPSLPDKSTEVPYLPFLPVTVVSTNHPDLKLIVSERYRVEIARGFDSDTLARLLAVLDVR